MVFSSNIFLFFFLPAVLLLYYALPKKLRNPVLLFSSLFFYAWGEPAYVGIMIFIILLNYACGARIAARKRRGESAKGSLTLGIVLNLAVLAVFKYSGFFARSLRVLPGMSWLPIPEIALPIGISFYIFQSMSYTIDVYRGEVEESRSLLNFGTYVSMFPQLIAGPIVRYRDVAQELRSRRESLSDFSAGVSLFVVGLAKKVLIANQVGALWEALIPEKGMLGAWVGMFAYTLQIYFDFSGYSDMAIGLGRMFGFHFLKNFDYPYISQSVTEFWRRWHISLSTWFKEYVYIPLGGNRSGVYRQLLNILIVWALTGLWHGASWNFVLWGLYYAVLLILEKAFLRRGLERLPVFFRHVLLILIVSFGWMLFYFTETPELFSFLRRLATPASAGIHEIHLILAYAPILLAACLAATPFPLAWFRRLEQHRALNWLRLPILAVLLLLCVAALATQSYNPFIYFRF